jgi:hypothetical protein
LTGVSNYLGNKRNFSKKMDHRVKPADDEIFRRFSLFFRGTAAKFRRNPGGSRQFPGLDSAPA